MLSSKTSFYIEEGINKDIALVAPFFENLWINTTLKKALISEKEEINELEMNFIPEKQEEFTSHKHFVLPSLLKRFQDFRPGSKPYKDYKFKKESIYLRKDVVHLHTAEQWKRLRRKVKKGEEPIKITKGNYNDKTKMARLYAAWQTEVYHIKLNDDGTLPENDYGNIEVFKPSDLPEGTTHLEVYGAKALCK